MILFFLFVGMPLIEIFVLLSVGQQVGLWPTLALIIATAAIGTLLLRQQGLAVMQRAQAQLNQGQIPAQALADGVCLFIAGAFLLTPGFVTDALGFALVFPPSRRWIQRYAAQSRMIRGRMSAGGYTWTTGSATTKEPSGAPSDDRPSVTIEGEYHERD